MSKSKCTCKNRRGAHVRDFWVPHEESCYYFTKLKEEAQARKDREDANRLYSHYRRVAKERET